MTFIPTPADLRLLDAAASACDHAPERHRSQHLGPQLRALARRMRAGVVETSTQQEAPAA
jgi:hypothetical protein